MSDIVPSLDTLEFDQLVEQARADIPRYAPDWTDHNLHDPGMTFIDLLAWIVDQQIYRTGFVGGRHKRAFAALVGIVSAGPEPARGLVWPGRAVNKGRFIKVGSEVVCREHPDLSFALDYPTGAGQDVGGQCEIYLPPTALNGISVAVEGVEQPARLAGSNGGSWALGESRTMASTVLRLGFQRPLGCSERMASVSIGIEVAPPPGPPPSKGDHSWGPVMYSYRVGAAPWTELRVVHDGTAGLATTGAVILTLPLAPAAETGASELRLSFDRGFFPVPPQIVRAEINVLPVIQQEQVRAARLGEPSTGDPDQTVELDTTDLINPSSRQHGPILEVEVDEGADGRICWEQKPDFSASGPADRHYVVRPDHVLFGNGLNGRRPSSGASISHTELARTRGAAGNVRRGLSWSLPALGEVGAAFGKNPQPFTGGKDATGINDLATAAREAATRHSVLLTDEDLVTATYGLAGMAVGRAEVVAGFDRRLSGHRVDGVRTLVVVPHQTSGTSSEGRPSITLASQAYLDEVAARLGSRRVLGERLVVQGPVVVRVDLWLTVTTELGTLPDDVRAAVEKALRNRLALLAPPEAVNPWPLGRNLTSSEVEVIAANVPGVGTVQVVQLAIVGDPPAPGPVRVPPDGLVVVNQIKVIALPGGSGKGAAHPGPDSGRGSTR
jgi:Baseplate J-like protein